MKRYANETKWNYLYTSLDSQVKNNQNFIFEKIPNSVSQEEVIEALTELRSLYNFKDYSFFQNDVSIRGIRNV